MTELRPGAIILAGGDGTRIGIPKLMLRAGKESFLARIARIMHESQIAPVLVVAAAHYDVFVQDAAPHAQFISIDDPDAPMLTSLQRAFRALDVPRSMLIAPVDHPFVSNATILAILGCAEREPMSVVKPEYMGTSGHPILLPKELIPLVLHAPESSTLRDVIRNAAYPQLRVSVDDPGILRNVNSRSDLDNQPS